MMDDKAIKELWQAANIQLAQNNRLTYPDYEKLQVNGVQNLVESMKLTKIIALLFGTVWVGVWSYLLINMILIDVDALSLSFLLSMSTQVILTALAIIIYCYQIIMIHAIAHTGSVIEVQSKLAQLRSTSLWVAKLLILQLPLWTTFYWNEHMFHQWNWIQWAVQGSLTAMFTVIAVWAFVNISIKNRNKKWFSLIFRGKDWKPIMDSIALLKGLEEYKENNK